ncbi:hydroxylysine kinase [Eurytemora carolleeae]|uniref:hydroxylysine kinase n=1 Tax=Eurytemora carolleeae TaxID=1294199 RepID=UPI000C77EB41|nr:hydroxylysine kinase [Eurytemora carolleeae]|eukprot:XP_023335145.1 hydroxylysine kinase-like [Eurytemora affinis]
MKEVEGGEYEVYGVLDFGDSHYNPLIYELAITIMYMMTQCRCIRAYKAGGHVIAGYITNRKLCDVERKILRLCVAARYAQSLVMGAFSYQQQPWNEYLLITSKTGWTILQEFWNIPEEQLYREWDAIISSYNPSQSSYFTSTASE